MIHSSLFFESLLLPIFLLLGSSLLSACSTALLKMGKFKSKEQLRSPNPPLFFFLPLLKKCFPKGEWENLYFSISVSKHILQIGFAIFAFFFVIATRPVLEAESWPELLTIGSVIIGISLASDFVFRLAATIWSRPLFKLIAPISSLYLIFLFPLVGILLRLSKGLSTKIPYEEDGTERLTDKSKLREMIRESELQRHLDVNDQKLISSFINFKERVAKEIMVPRVDLFSLEADTPIREAARLFAKEGYSRIPVFRETLDQIIGVVLYKDLLRYYSNPEHNLDASLESLVKPVLYAPENKKVALLLQEFRAKQIHMAIIVDEYGGTEGIVTIEDILEELVGEIEDEYDVEEDLEFWPLPTGGWIVDAKMSIIDIEEQLGVKIPEGLEYETIGGYVFHCAGTIPTKGWRLLRDDFDLEVISSNERSIKKIKIVPRATQEDLL